MTFELKLRQNKKDLKKSSQDTYLRNIRRLRKVFHALPIPVKDNSWLKEKKLIAWFDKEPLSVRRHLATAANIASVIYGSPLSEWKTKFIKI